MTVSKAAAPAPLVEDVTFRMSERGDAVGFDLECGDGQVRRLVFPTAIIPKLLAGFLWSGAEAARRAPDVRIPEQLKERIQDGARVATRAQLVRIESEPDVVLELEVGAAVVAIRLPETWAESLGVALLSDVQKQRAKTPKL